MPPDYSSMWAKLAHSEELLLGLDTEVQTWMNTAPYGFLTKIHEDKTGVSIIAKVKGDSAPLVRWSLILSDIFHNLRCVLDHMTWAIAVYERPGLDPLKNKRLQFPIWCDPPTANDRKRIEILSDSVRTAIDLVQPYRSLSDPVFPKHLLCILSWLDNTNKHNLLKMAESCVGAGDVRITWKGTGNPPKRTIHTGEVKDGTELLRFTFDAPQVDVKCEVGSLRGIVAIVYPETTARGTDRDDYAALTDSIIEKIKCVISVVAAAVV
jgi:hypothetical protein